MKNDFRTHYDNLKVSKDAPLEVIKSAYKALSFKHHPDRNENSTESIRIMKIINSSYEILSDPKKRELHDKWIESKINNEDVFAKIPKINLVKAKSGEFKTKQTHIKNSPLSVLIQNINNNKNQIFLKEKITLPQIFWFVISLIIVLILIYNYKEKWSSDSWYIAIIIGIFGVFCFSINFYSLFGLLTSKVKPGLLIDDNYLIFIKPYKLIYFPLGSIKKINLTHNYENGSYQGSLFEISIGKNSRYFETNEKSNSDIFLEKFNKNRKNSIYDDNGNIFVEKEFPFHLYLQKKVNEYQILSFICIFLYAITISWTIYFNKGLIEYSKSNQDNVKILPKKSKVLLDPKGNKWPRNSSYLSGYEIFRSNGNSSVTINNSKNDFNIYLKLEHVTFDFTYPVRHCFILKNDSFQLLNLTKGNYLIKYQIIESGDTFKSEVFSITEEESSDGIQYSTMEIFLSKVRNGNFETSKIPNEDF